MTIRARAPEVWAEDMALSAAVKLLSCSLKHRTARPEKGC
jgi:hypothetical protein